MAKIKNPIKFSTFYNIDEKVLKEMGIFNPIINIDTHLFIDPLLLKYSKFSEINKDACEEYRIYYENIIKLLKVSKDKNDKAWRSAKALLNLKEVQGTCLGYGVSSISGRNLSIKIQNIIIESAKEIIEIGISDPDLFLLLPLFEEGIGPDTISDMTTAVIENTLLKFTESIARKLRIDTIEYIFKGKKYNIIKNPKRKKITPIILIPEDILRHLPIVNSWEDIASAASFNETLRVSVNSMVADIWKAKTKKEKDKIKNEIFTNKKYLQDLLNIIKDGNVNHYDIEKDERSIVSWHKILDKVAVDFPLQLFITKKNKTSLNDCVKLIINQFMFLIENKGLNKLLWNGDKPNNEKVCQMLFFATAFSYCKANNIDINPEMDSGSGLVDFKFSKGYDKKVIVEIKLSYNPNIESGYRKQLELYKTSEETTNGFYVIVDVGKLGKKYDKILEIRNDSKDKLSEIIFIDGLLKPSASKRK